MSDPTPKPKVGWLPAGSGTSSYYYVEARSTYSRPQKVGGQLLDNRWQHIVFKNGPHGVPILTLNEMATQNYLMNYEAALALATWFMALPEDGDLHFFPALCVETRLVEVQFAYQYTSKEIGVGPTLNMLESKRATKFDTRTE